MESEKFELWQYLTELKMKDTSQTYCKFAKKIGIDRSRLSKIMGYRECPSLRTAIKIEEETDGMVDVWNMIKVCYKNREEKHATT